VIFHALQMKKRKRNLAMLGDNEYQGHVESTKKERRIFIKKGYFLG